MKIDRIEAPLCDYLMPENRSGHCNWLADYTITDDDGTVQRLCGDHAVEMYGVDRIYYGENA